MATLGRYESFAQDDSGNVLASPTVEVRREVDNALASVYSDRGGSTPLGNPFTGGSDGLIAFHALGAAYKIIVTKGAITRTLRYVPVGTGGESDVSKNNLPSTWVNVMDAPYNATGDGTTDDTTAIAAAMAATPIGGTLFFPVGAYKVIGSGSSIFTRTDMINVRGAGWGSVIIPHSSVPNTRDIFTFAPSVATQGWSVRDLSINNFGTGAGRHGLRFIQAGSLMYMILIENLYIASLSAGGHSIKADGTVATGGVLAYSTIRNCNLETIELINAGDGLVVHNNVIGANTAKHTFYASGVSGAGNLMLDKNVLTGTQCFALIEGYTSPRLSGNELEAAVTNTYGFLVDIKENSGASVVVSAAVLADNHYTVHPSIGDPIPVRIRTNVFNTSIKDKRSFIPTGSKHIQIDSGAQDTHWSTECMYYQNNLPVPAVVADSGTRTVVVTSGERISLSADQTGSNSSTAQTWFPGGGPTQFTVADDSTYEFEGMLTLHRTAGTTSHLTTVELEGTATVGSLRAIIQAVYDITNGAPLGAFSQGGGYSTASGMLFGGVNSSATEDNAVWIKGKVRFTAPGTFIPKFKYNTAPGGAPTVRANSWFAIRRIGGDAFLNNGYVS